MSCWRAVILRAVRLLHLELRNLALVCRATHSVVSYPCLFTTGVFASVLCELSRSTWYIADTLTPPKTKEKHTLGWGSVNQAGRSKTTFKLVYLGLDNARRDRHHHEYRNAKQCRDRNFPKALDDISNSLCERHGHFHTTNRSVALQTTCPWNSSPTKLEAILSMFNHSGRRHTK